MSSNNTPNIETTSLSRALGDANPDGLLGWAKPSAAGAANATIAAANLVNAILTATQSANITLTTDTAANIANQIGNASVNPAGVCFDFTVQANAAANTAITVAGGNGVTITGNATVTQGTSATFRVCLNANNTFTAYRI